MKLDELESLALAATQDWKARQRHGGSVDNEYTIETHSGGILFRSTSYFNMRQDSQFIEACSAQRILGLIRRVRALERGLELMLIQVDESVTPEQVGKRTSEVRDTLARHSFDQPLEDF